MILLALAACETESSPQPDPSPVPSATAPAAPAPEPPPGPAATPVPYDVPERTDAALNVALQQACEAAGADKRPVLVEFTAPWCSDCRKLHELKQQPPLREEIARWQPVTVNVGRFNRHRALLKHFDVKAIAQWTVLTPEQCSDPVQRWQVRAKRTLEPESGADKGVDPGELASWLAAHR